MLLHGQLTGSGAWADPLTIDHQGIARQYLLHQPAGDHLPRPLLIYLHGLRPLGWQNHTRSEIDAAADREGFGRRLSGCLGRALNYTGQLSDKTGAGDQIADDLGFIGKLIHRLSAEKATDANRVYAIGELRGGLMAFELMCRMANRIAVAAPLITGMTEGQRDACSPARPVPVLAVDGTADHIQQYDGWLIRPVGFCPSPRQWSSGACSMAAAARRQRCCCIGSLTKSSSESLRFR